ncbi:MAG: hypothetical protein GDA56_20170 [Hormoscilla sp. GM7CHS1pb]|nr:hypothetical protein [Hormoscilla sp. GM7CHS1pb]
MYAVVSREKIKLPPGTVMQMPGTWQDYCTLRWQGESYQQQTWSRYFPEIDLSTLIGNVLQAASTQGTGIALRELRQQLIN